MPLADLLLELRADVVAAGRDNPGWRLGLRGFAALSAHRRLWDLVLGAAGSLAPLVLRRGKPVAAPRVVRAWTDTRDLPAPAPRSFARLWARRSSHRGRRT